MFVCQKKKKKNPAETKKKNSHQQNFDTKRLEAQQSGRERRSVLNLDVNNKRSVDPHRSQAKISTGGGKNGTGGCIFQNTRGSVATVLKTLLLLQLCFLEQTANIDNLRFCCS